MDQKISNRAVTVMIRVDPADCETVSEMEQRENRGKENKQGGDNRRGRREGKERGGGEGGWTEGGKKREGRGMTLG